MLAKMEFAFLVQPIRSRWEALSVPRYLRKETPRFRQNDIFRLALGERKLQYSLAPLAAPNADQTIIIALFGINCLMRQAEFIEPARLECCTPG